MLEVSGEKAWQWAAFRRGVCEVMEGARVQFVLRVFLLSCEEEKSELTCWWEDQVADTDSPPTSPPKQ